MRLTGELICRQRTSGGVRLGIQRATEKDSVARLFRFGDQGTATARSMEGPFACLRRTSLVHNSFEPYFYGRSPKRVENGGTRTVPASGDWIAFMQVWFAFVSLIGACDCGPCGRRTRNWNACHARRLGPGAAR